MVVRAETLTLPTRGWRIDHRKALVVAAVCWLAFAGIVWAVANGHAESVDRLGLMFWRTGPDLRPAGPAWLSEGVRDVTSLGGVLLRNLIAIGAVTALLFLRLRREALLLAVTVALGWGVDWAIKVGVGRPRPTLVPHLTEAGGTSFPSGHSFNSAVVYIAIALAFATLSARESVRYTIVASAIVLSLIIAWTRVWLGVHFPTDVIAGWLGGAGWAFLAAAVLQQPVKQVADQTLH